jgi:hypothetical protein
MLAIIGGEPRRFAPFADLYRRALAELGKAELPIGVHSHGFVGESDAQAREDLFGDYKRMRDRIDGERGWPPMSRADFEREIEVFALRRVARHGRAQDRGDRQRARRAPLPDEI